MVMDSPSNCHQNEALTISALRARMTVHGNGAPIRTALWAAGAPEYRGSFSHVLLHLCARVLQVSLLCCLLKR